jgi:thiol-disulfide isomerase/thioredoxin
MKRLFLALVSVMPLILGSCGSSSEKDPTDLIIRHMPNPVTAVQVTDDEKGTTSYKWKFRTEVINTTSIPVKIVNFSSFSLINGEWVNSNISGSVYSNDEFIKWYDSGDEIQVGWLFPGKKAADSKNWVKSSWQVYGRSMWRYIAVDSLGNEYIGEKEAYLLPYYEEKDYWESTESSELIAIEGRILDSEGKPLDYAQIRITHFRGNRFKPYDVLLADLDGRFKVRAARPGLYRLYAYSPGYGTIDRAIALSGSNQDITMSLIMKSADEQSEVVLTDAGKYLERVWAIEQDMSSERESSSAAYREYLRTHKDASGFRYDWSMPESVLTDLVENDLDEAVRKFAALMLAEVMNYSGGSHDVQRLEWLFDILPPDSPYWGSMPSLPSWLCIRNRDNLKEECLMRFEEENPDRAVRAHATIYLAILMDRIGDFEKGAEYYELARSEYSDIGEIRSSMQMMDPNRKIKKGRDIPDFQITTMDNPRDITRETLRGKYWLIHFWATWCGPCKPDMKYLHEAYEKFKEKDFGILSISIDKDAENVKSYRSELWPMPWENAVEVKGTESVIGKEFEVTGVPKMVLVDPEGKIVEVGMSLRGDKLVPFLEKCINKEK